MHMHMHAQQGAVWTEADIRPRVHSQVLRALETSHTGFQSCISPVTSKRGVGGGGRGLVKHLFYTSAEGKRSASAAEISQADVWGWSICCYDMVHTTYKRTTLKIKTFFKNNVLKNKEFKLNLTTQPGLKYFKHQF